MYGTYAFKSPSPNHLVSVIKNSGPKRRKLRAARPTGRPTSHNLAKHIHHPLTSYRSILPRSPLQYSRTYTLAMNRPNNLAIQERLPDGGGGGGSLAQNRNAGAVVKSVEGDQIRRTIMVSLQQCKGRTEGDAYLLYS